MARHRLALSLHVLILSEVLAGPVGPQAITGGPAPSAGVQKSWVPPHRVARFDPRHAFDGHRLLTGVGKAAEIPSGGVHDAFLWSLETGELLCRFEGHGDPINVVAFSPDDKLVATGSGSALETNVYSPIDGSIRLWDSATGAEVQRLDGHPDGQVLVLGFSASGERILSAGRDSTARVWHARSGRQLFVIDNVRGLPPVAEFSADGRTVLAIVRRTVRVFKAATGDEVCRMTFEDPRKAFHAAAFSPDGLRVITISTGSVVGIWDARTGQALREIAGHEKTAHDAYIGNVSQAQFSVDGQLAVTASADGTVRLWDCATGEERMRLAHPGPVRQVVLSPDGSRCLATWRTYDGLHRGGPLRASLWDLESGREITQIADRAEGLVGFAPDGATYLIAGLGPESLWDSGTGTLIRRYGK